MKSLSVPTQVKANEQFFSLFSSADNYIDFNCIDSNEVIYATHYSLGKTQNLQTALRDSQAA